MSPPPKPQAKIVIIFTSAHYVLQSKIDGFVFMKCPAYVVFGIERVQIKGARRTLVVGQRKVLESFRQIGQYIIGQHTEITSVIVKIEINKP